METSQLPAPKIPRFIDTTYGTDEEELVGTGFQTESSDSEYDNLYQNNTDLSVKRKKRKKVLMPTKEMSKLFLQWKNDQLRSGDHNVLLEGMDETEFKQLFRITHRSAFTSVVESKKNREKMEPFLDITEEEQEKKLREANVLEPKKHHQTLDNMSGLALFSRVDDEGRALLKRQVAPEFVIQLEKELIQFIQSTSDPSSQKKELILKISDGFHRLLCHAICQYYSLQSQSFDTQSGYRVTVIWNNKKVGIPKVLLSTFLEFDSSIVSKDSPVQFTKIESFVPKERTDYSQRKKKYRKKRYHKH